MTPSKQLKVVVEIMIKCISSREVDFSLFPNKFFQNSFKVAFLAYGAFVLLGAFFESAFPESAFFEGAFFESVFLERAFFEYNQYFVSFRFNWFNTYPVNR